MRRVDIVGAASEKIEESNMLKKLESLPSLSSECSIYRVPKRLRKWNDDAYTPQVVSIGPLHHGSNGMQAMEEHKLRYLKDFLSRTQMKFEDYAKFFSMREEKIRNHYEETIKLKSHEFLDLIMVDTAFVIEVMLRFKFTHQHNEYDRIFSKPWLIKSIRFDMLLLENQLPFFILEELFVQLRRTFPPENAERYSLIELTHYFFQSEANLVGLEQLWGKLRASKIEHFLHFIYICHLPFQLPPKKEIKTLTLPSAKQLHQVGVKFKEGSTTNIYNIKFENGILEIPRLQIRGQTETVFRNFSPLSLIASSTIAAMWNYLLKKELSTVSYQIKMK